MAPKKKRQHTEQGDADGGGKKPAYSGAEAERDPVKAIIAIQPKDGTVALAVGSAIRIVKGSSQVSLNTNPNASVIRAIQFDPTGTYLAAVGDAKLIQIYKCIDWSLIKSLKGPKKFTTVTFTPDGQYVLAGDKFGDVLVTAAAPAANDTELCLPSNNNNDNTNQPTRKPPPVPILLGHFCSIISSMELSPDGNYVATADRDQKVRITCMPPPGTDLLHHRAHEIQSYCMGHRSFVTCTAWAQRYNNNDNNGDSSPSSSPPSSSSSSSSSLLLSGSGDGTIRVWHPLTGHLMNTLHITPPPPSSSSEQEEEKEIVMAVLNVAVSPDGQWVLAAVEGSNSLLLCSLLRKNSKNDDKTTDGSDIERVELTQVKWLDVPGLYLPTSVCFDTTATTGEKGGEYWRVLAAGGPPSETSLASFVCAGMISTTQDDDNNNKNGGWIVASYDDDSSLSAENLVFLEQHHDDDGKEGEEGKTREELGAQAAGRENLVNLRKSVYSAEEIALRKKARGVVITSC